MSTRGQSVWRRSNNQNMSLFLTLLTYDVHYIIMKFLNPCDLRALSQACTTAHDMVMRDNQTRHLDPKATEMSYRMFDFAMGQSIEYQVWLIKQLPLSICYLVKSWYDMHCSRYNMISTTDMYLRVCRQINILEEREKHVCVRCKKPAEKRVKCSTCKVEYCSAKCKKAHVKTHKKACTYLPSPEDSCVTSLVPWTDQL
jgi:hypothetical protein